MHFSLRPKIKIWKWVWDLLDYLEYYVRLLGPPLWKISNKRNTDEELHRRVWTYYASKHNRDLVPLLKLKWESINLKPTADSAVQCSAVSGTKHKPVLLSTKMCCIMLNLCACYNSQNISACTYPLQGLVAIRFGLLDAISVSLTSCLDKKKKKQNQSIIPFFRFIPKTSPVY